MQNIKILSGAAQVTITLRQAITSGELAPGTRLREVDLSKKLGVSRSPIREAFRILEAEELVRITPNRGAFVVQLHEKDLREIYELRLLLETHAVRVACKKMSKEDLSEMEVIMDNMEKRLEVRDYVGYLRVSHGLHEFYVGKCGNQRLVDLFRNIWNITLATNSVIHSYLDHGAESLKEHRRIFDALAQRDSIEAEKCVKKHLECGYKRASIVIKQQMRDPANPNLDLKGHSHG